jgi:hypothetical protein
MLRMTAEGFRVTTGATMGARCFAEPVLSKKAEGLSMTAEGFRMT